MTPTLPPTPKTPRRRASAAKLMGAAQSPYITWVPTLGGGYWQLRLPADLDPKRSKIKFWTKSQTDAAKDLAKRTAEEERDRRLRILDTDRAERAARGDKSFPASFAEVASDYVEQSKIVTREERKGQLRKHAYPLLSKMLVSTISYKDVTAVLAAAAATGLTRQSVRHLLLAVRAVLEFAAMREQIPDPGPLLRLVRMPAFDEDAEESRPRAMVTDAEFEQLINCEEVDFELRLLAVVSRTLGGMRTSDLRAWDWSHVDTTSWRDAYVPRPKTRKSKKAAMHLRHALPALTVHYLKLWWMQMGRPAKGPVFSDPRRSTDTKVWRRSHARALRAALKAAGCTRHELHHSTPVSLRVDFHSFRRAYATAIAASGVNAQSAMALAGHASLQTHLRYVQISESLAVPDAAIPSVRIPGAKGESTTG